MHRIPTPTGESGKFKWSAALLISLLPLISACSSGVRFLSDAAIADGSKSAPEIDSFRAPPDAGVSSPKQGCLPDADTGPAEAFTAVMEAGPAPRGPIKKTDPERDGTIPEEKKADRRFYAAYSEIFGVALTGTEDRRLLRELKRWLGVPYRWGGCSGQGVDCSCLVREVYKKVYGTDMKRTVRTMLDQKDLEPVDQSELDFGDLVFFRTRGKRINHMGIYLADGAFVHASRSSGVRVSRLDAPYYRRGFARVGRHKNMLLKNASSRLHVGKLIIQ